MTRTEIDYRAAFQDLPGAFALLTPDLVVVDANRDFLDVTALETVLATGIRDAMGTNRYALEVQGRPGGFEERYWAVTNGPVLSSDGQVVLIINRVEEITHIIRQVLKAQPGRR